MNGCAESQPQLAGSKVVDHVEEEERNSVREFYQSKLVLFGFDLIDQEKKTSESMVYGSVTINLKIEHGTKHHLQKVNQVKKFNLRELL